MTLAPRQVLQARQGINFNFKIWSAPYLSDLLPEPWVYYADGQALYLPDAEWHEEHDATISLAIRAFGFRLFGRRKKV